MAKGKKEQKSQIEPEPAKDNDLPRRPKVHTPELLKAYRIAADLKSLPEESDAKVADAWKLKESDLKGFHQSLRQQEDAFRKAWQDEKNRLDGLWEKKRQEERAAEARNLEAESAARRGAPPAGLVDQVCPHCKQRPSDNMPDTSEPTLALIDRVLGEYAT